MVDRRYPIKVDVDSGIRISELSHKGHGRDLLVASIYSYMKQGKPDSTSIMFAVRRSLLQPTVQFRSIHASRALLAANTSPLESALRDGLKTAMKSKDRPAATCIKVSDTHRYYTWLSS
jgi:hypothetical protein